MTKSLAPPPDTRRRLNFQKPDDQLGKHSEFVIASCGHKVLVEFPPKARFIAETIAKTNRRPCKQCRALQESERRRAAVERRAMREKFPTGKPRPRLPHGARFEATYDAVSKTWSGSLVVPGDLTPCGSICCSRATGVFKLLELLDATYREHEGNK